MWTEACPAPDTGRLDTRKRGGSIILLNNQPSKYKTSTADPSTSTISTVSTISTIHEYLPYLLHCHGMGKEAELYNDYRCLSHPWPLYTCEQRSRRRYTISAIWKLIGRNSGPRYLTPCACNVTQRTHEAKLRTRRSKIYKVFSLLASLITLMFSKFLNNTKHQYVIIFKIILFIKIFI